MKPPLIKLEYDSETGSLYAIVNERYYGLCHTSGEMFFTSPIADYYWKGGQDCPIIVRKLFEDIVSAYNKAAKCEKA